MHEHINVFIAGLDAVKIWKLVETKILCETTNSFTAEQSFSNCVDALQSNSMNNKISESTTTEIDDFVSISSSLGVNDKLGATITLETPSPTPNVHSNRPQYRRGGAQLANAILSNNPQAMTQLITSYREELDVNYFEKKHGHPLTTLAILSSQFWAAKLLLEQGADPLRLNKSRRSVVYIAVEAGLSELVEFIFLRHSHIDINSPCTQELQRYFPIHVAARYEINSFIFSISFNAVIF